MTVATMPARPTLLRQFDLPKLGLSEALVLAIREEVSEQGISIRAFGALVGMKHGKIYRTLSNRRKLTVVDLVLMGGVLGCGCSALFDRANDLMGGLR